MIKEQPDRKTPKDIAKLIKEGGLKQTSEEKSKFEIHYDIRIGCDGTWYYLDTPINRPAIVKLFSKAIWRDVVGDYWLVTPVERGRIEVDDAPFVAIEMITKGEGRETELRFRTNLDEFVIAGKDHPIRVSVDPTTEEPRPYILIRNDLEALISRSVFYELVDHAEEIYIKDTVELRVWSRGKSFPLGTVGWSGNV